MIGYTKLFGSIIASTIWREDNVTRIVWITMLAMKNSDHRVEASVPGLADLARVSVAECRGAIKKLEAPDEDSRSKEHEGRRIMPIPEGGGWIIINGEKYRRKMNADERREYLRRKQAEWRERQRESRKLGVNKSKQSSTLSTQSESEPYSEPETQEIQILGERERLRGVVSILQEAGITEKESKRLARIKTLYPAHALMLSQRAMGCCDVSDKQQLLIDLIENHEYGTIIPQDAVLRWIERGRTTFPMPEGDVDSRLIRIV